MGDIYIETDENFRVTKIHRMPFDPNNGMGYTREELEKRGFFVDNVPEPVHQIGRRSIAMYDPDTKSIYYECVGVPLSDKERVECVENAFNSLLDSMYGVSQTYGLTNRDMAISLDDDNNSEEEIDENLKPIGIYLAYQVISGKIDINKCFDKYPQFRSTIEEVLKDNGIQP